MAARKSFAKSAHDLRVKLRRYVPGISESPESPDARKARLAESVHFWTWEALQANEQHRFDDALEYLLKAQQTALTLRKHMTGV